MKQACLGLNLTAKRMRRREVLAQMGLSVPWAARVDLIAPCAFDRKRGRSPFVAETMPRVHFMLAHGLDQAPSAPSKALCADFPSMSCSHGRALHP